jgi:probable F420-dependent oxidoreductase
MDIGIALPTHGIMARDAAGNSVLTNLPADQMRPVELAERAEALGYHSVWFSDHVVTERVTSVDHPANTSGKRVYPDRPVILDVVATMGAIAARTTRLRMAPSVYISPYRHPLTTAHQFATLDVLSAGRVIMAVGVGWETGEFAALGVSYADRGAITEECLEVYRQAWTRSWIDFRGRFFDITDVSMDPKPVQSPHPPIWYGGMSRVAARRAARHCDGFYPLFLDAVSDPARMTPLHDEIAREAGRLDRDLTGFALGGFSMARLDRRPGDARPLLTGPPDQLLSDLEHYARYGYSHLTLHFDCPSGTLQEYLDQCEWFAAEVLPGARTINPTLPF